MIESFEKSLKKKNISERSEGDLIQKEIKPTEFNKYLDLLKEYNEVNSKILDSVNKGSKEEEYRLRTERERVLEEINKMRNENKNLYAVEDYINNLRKYDEISKKWSEAIHARERLMEIELKEGTDPEKIRELPEYKSLTVKIEKLGTELNFVRANLEEARKGMPAFVVKRLEEGRSEGGV